MATKNLVPRLDGEGNIGIASRKWKQANFKTGFFDKTQTNELKNIADANLLVAGDNITIAYANSQYTINSSGGGGGGSSQLNDLADVTIVTPASGHILVYDGANSFDNVLMSGDVTIDVSGVTTIGAGAVDYAMINPVAIKDDDLMTADSAVHLATQQSIKAYVDSKTSSATFDIASLSAYNLDLAASDYFAISTNSANKKVTIPALSKFVYSVVSGDATINSTGSLQLNNTVTARTNLGLAIGTHVQPHNTNLTSIAGLTPTDGNIIVGNDSSWVAESGDTARASLGLGTVNSPSFLSLSLSGQATDLTMNTKKITGLGTPTAPSDAATKGYTDSVASGLAPLASVKAATTAGLAATYDATGSLTASAPASFTTDSNVSSFALNNRILVKDQSTAMQNGIYKITTLGDVNTAWVLKRTSDFDVGLTTTAGSFIFVEEGDTNKKQGFVCISPETSDTVGTHGIIWSTFSKAGEYTAGSGLTLAGGTAFTLDISGLGTMSGDVVKDDLLAIYDDTGSVTESKSVGAVLADMTDDTTIEVDSSSKQLKIKDAGVSFAKIQEITNYKVLGHIDANAGASTAGVTSEIQVVKSTTDNSEWNDPQDNEIPTQLSVSNLVGNSSSGTSNSYTTPITFAVTSLAVDADGDASVKVNVNNIITLVIPEDISSYEGKTITVYLKGNTWNSNTRLHIHIPRITANDYLKDYIKHKFEKGEVTIAFNFVNLDASLASGGDNPTVKILCSENDPSMASLTSSEILARENTMSNDKIWYTYFGASTLSYAGYNSAPAITEVIKNNDMRSNVFTFKLGHSAINNSPNIAGFDRVQ